MRRRMKRAITSAILIAIAVGATAVASPSAWREAEDAMRGHLRSVEAIARPAAERSADWFERQTDALRNRLGGTQVGVGKAAEARKLEPVRIARGAGAVTGSAHVIDGDTLDVGGVRIRLHGIDAPESGQSCRAGGNRWSCGCGAARALAGWIGGSSIACQERDRDRYGRIVAVCRASGMNLNAWMVAEGWAFAYRRYSNAYVGEESAARAPPRASPRGTPRARPRTPRARSAPRATPAPAMRWPRPRGPYRSRAPGRRRRQGLRGRAQGRAPRAAPRSRRRRDRTQGRVETAKGRPRNMTREARTGVRDTSRPGEGPASNHVGRARHQRPQARRGRRHGEHHVHDTYNGQWTDERGAMRPKGHGREPRQ